MSLEATRPSVYSTENESGFKPFNIETCLLSVFMFCYGTMYEIIWLNPVLFRSRIWLLLVRSFKVLFKREKLVIGAIAVHMLIAFTFSFIAGDLSEETGNVLSMYGIGSMLLIIANIQFGFFIFKNNQVIWICICRRTLSNQNILPLGIHEGAFSRIVLRLSVLVIRISSILKLSFFIGIDVRTDEYWFGKVG